MNRKPKNKKEARLNFGHDHSDGLVAAYLFNDNSNEVFDWTKNSNDLLVNNAVYTDDGMEFLANNQYASLNNANGAVSNEEGTLIVDFKSNVVFADSVIHTIFGVLAATTGDFTLVKWSDNSLYFLLRDSAGNHYITLRTSSFPDWQTGVQIAIIWNRNTPIWNSDNMVYNINGVNTLPVGAAGETGWLSHSTNSSLYVGNDSSDTTRYVNGCVKRLYLYNKALEEDKIKSIYESSYANFKKNQPGEIKISYGNAMSEHEN